MTWYNVDELVQFRLEESVSFIANTLSDDFHTQATPFPLCIEMVEKVGSYLDQERHWLVIANLEFLLVLRKYFEYRGWNFEDNVSFATPCEKKAEFARFIGVKDIVKYSYSDFKEFWNVSKKFDVIIGNPPFQMPDQQSGKRGSKGSTEKLWPYFAKLAQEIVKSDGYVSLIHPLSWLSGTRDIAKGKIKLIEIFAQRQILFLDVTVKKHFPKEGSTFGYYIIKNCNNIQLTEVKTDDFGLLQIDFTKTKFIPSSFNPYAISINDKVIFNDSEKFKFKCVSPVISSQDRKDTQDAIYQYKVYACGKNGKSQAEDNLKPDNYIYFLKEKHELHDYNKVIINASVGDTFQAYADNGKIGLGVKSLVSIIDNDSFSLDAAISFWNSKLIKFLFQHNRFSGWINNTVIKNIPKMDMSKVWTDKELYEYFNLTQEEINLINMTIK